MILMSAEVLAVFELLDPASARRLVIGRTGRAFVWDPIASTTEVPLDAARALVAEGVVDARGRIALEHIGAWQYRGAMPRPSSTQHIKPAAVTGPGHDAAALFERTLPIGQSSEALRAMG
ncbi:MAG: hypothetical protein JWR07_2188 [Nevskia sp.]|nr:hypothetical protein [Nevskia sp.]